MDRAQATDGQTAQGATFQQPEGGALASQMSRQEATQLTPSSAIADPPVTQLADRGAEFRAPAVQPVEAGATPGNVAPQPHEFPAPVEPPEMVSWAEKFFR